MICRKRFSLIFINQSATEEHLFPYVMTKTVFAKRLTQKKKNASNFQSFI